MFEKKSRQGLVVYLYYNRDARKLNKYGDVLYHSRRMRYLIIYVDKDKIDVVMNELTKMKFVREVKKSQIDAINTHFVGSLQE